jgi:hypothetical protein
MEPSYHGFKRILKIQVPIRGGTGPPILHNYEVSRVKAVQNKTLLNRSWSRQHLSSPPHLILTGRGKCESGKTKKHKRNERNYVRARKQGARGDRRGIRKETEIE